MKSIKERLTINEISQIENWVKKEEYFKVYDLIEKKTKEDILKLIDEYEKKMRRFYGYEEQIVNTNFFEEIEELKSKIQGK